MSAYEYKYKQVLRHLLLNDPQQTLTGRFGQWLTPLHLNDIAKHT